VTSGQFESHEFVLVPLTPIHVGGGEEAQWLPEDYRLSADRGCIERISARAVLARLDEKMRADLIAKFDRDPPGFIRELQKRARNDEVVEQISVSAESAAEIDLSADGRSRKNQIDGFFRAGGQPTIPGSSIKGAIRTAWLRALWEFKKRSAHGRDPWTLPDIRAWAAMPPRGRESRAASARQLEEVLLDLAPGKRSTDTDPFRDVSVADVAIPKGATRIDRIADWKKSQRGYGIQKNAQMHRERLRSVMDGGEPPVLRVVLGLRAGEVRKRRSQLDGSKDRTPRVPIESADLLLAALEMHHAELWERELEKYFRGPEGERLRQALEVFRAFRRKGKAPEAALIRIGWAAHAEAKSLAPVRRIERPQAKGDGRFAREGSTRHVIDISGHPAPFGWALLVRAEAWAEKAPARYLDPPAPRRLPKASDKAGGTAAQSGRGDTRLGSQILYAKGARVIVDGEEATLDEDVTRAHKPSDMVMADFGEGPDTVKVGDIERQA